VSSWTPLCLYNLPSNLPCCHACAVLLSLSLCAVVPQVAAFGKTTLGLTYSLVLGEAVLSPAIPSVAARAGGIFFPLAKVGAGFNNI